MCSSWLRTGRAAREREQAHPLARIEIARKRRGGEAEDVRLPAQLNGSEASPDPSGERLLRSGRWVELAASELAAFQASAV